MSQDLKKKLFMLRSMRHTSMFLQENEPFKRWIATPVNLITVFVGICAFLLGNIIFNYFFKTFDLPRIPCLDLIFGVFCAITYKINSKLPKSLNAHMDKLLTEYEPEDKKAFKEFQVKCGNSGRIEFSDLATWIDIETQAISRQTQEPLNFTKK